jgi:hypothetical protein
VVSLPVQATMWPKQPMIQITPMTLEVPWFPLLPSLVHWSSEIIFEKHKSDHRVPISTPSKRFYCTWIKSKCLNITPSSFATSLCLIFGLCCTILAFFHTCNHGAPAHCALCLQCCPPTLLPCRAQHQCHFFQNIPQRVPHTLHFTFPTIVYSSVLPACAWDFKLCMYLWNHFSTVWFSCYIGSVMGEGTLSISFAHWLISCLNLLCHTWWVFSKHLLDKWLFTSHFLGQIASREKYFMIQGKRCECVHEWLFEASVRELHKCL